MGLFGKSENTVEAECKKGDGWKSGQKSVKEALKDSEKHGEEKHGDGFLGMKWS